MSLAGRLYQHVRPFRHRTPSQVAKRYESPARILMEFVDNPLDGAEEMFVRSGGR